MNTVQPIKTAIIGLGMMGFSQFRNCFLPSDDYEVTAVCEIYEPNIERFKTYCAEHDLNVPLYKDYKENRVSNEFGEFKPEMKGDYKFANLNDLFLEYINESLKEAIPAFGKKIKGFDSNDAILSGVESRTSSPVKIIRNENFESNLLGLYPCGEGAGYAGGIMTAAMDGMKVAEEIIKNYSNEF